MQTQDWSPGQPSTGLEGRRLPPDPTRPAETILRRETLEVEHKRYDLQLRENARGRFVRIKELSRSPDQRPNIVIVPEGGWGPFLEAFGKVVAP